MELVRRKAHRRIDFGHLIYVKNTYKKEDILESELKKSFFYKLYQLTIFKNNYFSILQFLQINSSASTINSTCEHVKQSQSP